jgi:hydrogenase maturation protease
MNGDVLVAGIGNIFLTDDGFGVEVASRLARQSLPPGAHVVDFGIRGVHLAYELLDGYRGLILIDAVPMGEPPGTLAVIQPDADDPVDAGAGAGADAVVDAHGMNPQAVLATLVRLGGRLDHVYVVACQPASLEEGIGLTPPVASAIDGALDLCRQLVIEEFQPAEEGTTP